MTKTIIMLCCKLKPSTTLTYFANPPRIHNRYVTGCSPSLISNLKLFWTKQKRRAFNIEIDRVFLHILE